MTQTDEALLISFYSHKLHVDDVCSSVDHTSDSMMKTCNDLFAILLNTECHEIVSMLRKYDLKFPINASDVPQFSSLTDCVFKVPGLVKDCGIEDLTYTQMGFMLRVKPRKEGADMKYGENHAKTAAQMGLCTIWNCRIYPSYLGVAFEELSKEEQEQLIPMLVLFIPYIFNLYSSKANYHNIIDSLSMLKESTKKRRLSNIWKLIEVVNRELPYEFQIIRY